MNKRDLIILGGALFLCIAAAVITASGLANAWSVTP